MTDELLPLVRGYLDEMHASSVLSERVLVAQEFYTNLLAGEQLRYFFISESMAPDGQRIYENAWFIFDRTWGEAHNILLEDKFDLTKPREVPWVILSRRAYTPGKATTESRLTLDFQLGDGRVSGDLKASSANCEHLFKFYKTYLVPLAIS